MLACCQEHCGLVPLPSSLLVKNLVSNPPSPHAIRKKRKLFGHVRNPNSPSSFYYPFIYFFGGRGGPFIFSSNWAKSEFQGQQLQFNIDLWYFIARPFILKPKDREEVRSKLNTEKIYAKKKKRLSEDIVIVPKQNARFQAIYNFFNNFKFHLHQKRMSTKEEDM